MADHYIYSSAITIKFVKGKDLSTAQNLVGDRAKAFEYFVLTALEALEKIPTGRNLLRAVSQTSHRCIIFAGNEQDVSQDGCALPYPAGIGSGMARMAKTFRPIQKNLTVSMKQNKAAAIVAKQKGNTQAAESWMEGYQKAKAGKLEAGVKTGMIVTKTDAKDEFVRVLKRALKKPGLITRACGTAGISIDDLIAMVCGEKKMSDEVYYSLCYSLYDCLTPGVGCGTQVRLMQPDIFMAQGFAKEIYDECKTLFSSKKKGWAKAAAILLGHELVHAWRMMAGLRIVDSGMDEELITVGFGPFTSFPLTENRLRADFKVPLRHSYQGMRTVFNPAFSKYTDGVARTSDFTF